MASLSSLYVSLDKLKTMVATLEQKNEKGVELTVSVSDKADKFGKNVSCLVSQSKEDREAKKEPFRLGNGNTFWSNGNQEVIKNKKPTENVVKAEVPKQVSSDLPF